MADLSVRSTCHGYRLSNWLNNILFDVNVIDSSD